MQYSCIFLNGTANDTYYGVHKKFPIQNVVQLSMHSSLYDSTVAFDAKRIRAFSWSRSFQTIALTCSTANDGAPAVRRTERSFLFPTRLLFMDFITDC